MIICDCHCDTLYRLMQGKTEGNDISLEILEKSKTSLQTMAMFVGDNPDETIVLEKMEKMLLEFEKLKAKGAKQLFSPADAKEGESALMLSIEGGEAYQKGFDLLDYYIEKGVRMASLTWNYDNKLAYCHLNDKTLGLSSLGLKFVKYMQDKKLAVDVSHLNEGGFWDIMNKSSKAPMASHSCARKLCNHTRNLTDEQLKALFQSGGFVGVNFYPAFLSEDNKASCETIARHIDHMYQLGGKGKVGFGSDFDGIETKPEGLNTPLQYPNLLSALKVYGFEYSDIEDIAGKAFIEYYNRL